MLNSCSCTSVGEVSVTSVFPASAELMREEESLSKAKVTMVAWDCHDSVVVTAVNNYLLKVWNSYTGQLLHILKVRTGPLGRDVEGRQQTFTSDTLPLVVVFRAMRLRCLSWSHTPSTPGSCCPPVTMGTCTCGICSREPGSCTSSTWCADVCDCDLKMVQATDVFVPCFQIEGQGHGAVFDCKFTPDGQSFACTDSHGHLLIFGFGSSKPFEKARMSIYTHTQTTRSFRQCTGFYTGSAGPPRCL